MNGVPRESRARAAGAACALGGFLLMSVLLAPSLGGAKAFVPADYWLGTVPFAFTQPPEWRAFHSNSLLGDPAILYPPQLWVLRNAIAAGEFPFWNRFVRGGEAMLGSGQSGPLAPTTWPILLLPWPTGFAWAAWLRFGVLWLGAYRFGRALGLARAGSVAVAVGFCSAPLFAVHFEQLPRATAHVALPWLLLAVERMATSAKRRAARALPLAPWAAFALVAGYPPAALTVIAGAALYAALRLPWRPLGRALALRAWVAAMLAIGVALAAPVLLPFAVALRDSATLGDRGDGGQWVLPAAALRMLVDPFAFGSPMANAAQPYRGPENFEEAQQYIGMLPWVLLLVGLRSLRRLSSADRLRAAALAGVAAVAASLAFGWWPLHPLLTLVPPFSFNSNPRLLFLAQTAIAVLAVLLGMQTLLERPVSVRGFAASAALTTLLGAGLLATATGDWAPRPWLAFSAALCLVAALQSASSPAQRRFAAALVPALWLADVGAPYAALHPQVPRDWADPARAVAALPEPLRADLERSESGHEARGSQSEPVRVAFERITAPNLPALFGIEDVRSYSFPSPRRYDRFAYEVMGVQAAMNLVREDLVLPDVLAGLERTCAGWLLTTQRYEETPLAERVERVFTRNERIQLYRLLRASPCAAWYPRGAVTLVGDLDASIASLRASLGGVTEAIFIEDETGSGAAPATSGPAIETALRWTGPNSIEVEIPPGARDRDGFVVLRVSHDPGWSARSDQGAALEVVPAQVRFLAVEVPAETERLALQYRPPHWALAWCIASAALVALGAGWITTRRASGATPVTASKPAIAMQPAIDRRAASLPSDDATACSVRRDARPV